MTTFTVPGLPVPQGSMRAFLPKNSKHPVVTHNHPAPLKNYRARIALAAQSAGVRITHGAVRIDVAFTFPRPKNHFGQGRNLRVLKPFAPRHKLTAPDLDKCLRSLLDALTGVAFDDDAQVTQITATKGYAEQPRTEVQVRPLEETKGERHGTSTAG